MKFDVDEMSKPPVTRSRTGQQLDNIVDKLLRLNYLGHNQADERHAKLATEASLPIVSFEQGDGLIRQKFVLSKL